MSARLLLALTTDSGSSPRRKIAGTMQTAQFASKLKADFQTGSPMPTGGLEDSTDQTRGDSRGMVGFDGSFDD